MMNQYILDIETDGLLKDLTKIHVAVLRDIDSGHVSVLRAIHRGIDADLLIGHNIIGFDIPAIKKITPSWSYQGRIRDTLIMSQVIFPNLYEIDVRSAPKSYPDLPKKLYGRHSLKAWGYRLGENKTEYTGGWEAWSQEMEDYCIQDTAVTLKLYNYLNSQSFSEDAMQLEHDVKRIITRQELYGFRFNKEAATQLYLSLITEKNQLHTKLEQMVDPWYTKDGKSNLEAAPGLYCNYIPKVNSHGYTKGAPVNKVTLNQFNPASRDHIGQVLVRLYGWKPTEFGADGKPTVDEGTIKDLPYPIIPDLLRYLVINKLLGMLAEGKQAWLHQERSGRMHGAVNTMGAVTSRMTHSNPNMAQIPSCKKPFGTECRSLFTAAPGNKIVGADASELELRMLAHYMARYDDGAYGDGIVKGDKSLGTDSHSMTQKAAGLPTRDNAKTLIYALCYGAGDEKIGAIIGKGRQGGKKLRDKLMKNLPALGRLIEAVKGAAKRGYLLGLDGRKIPVRSEHAALNSLLQSAGAIVMKRALVILDEMLQTRGYVPGRDYEFVANIHDEFQIEVMDRFSNIISELAPLAIQLAGEYYKMRCPLAGESKIGNNWAETH